MGRIGRAQKRSVAGAAAYRAGERLVDPRTGAEYDYSRRRGVASTHLLVPGAPEDALDRQHLWGEIERHHKKGNAVTGREVVVSIPWDLDPMDRQELVLRYAAELVERYGVAVDVAIHLPSLRPGRDPRNHHAHLLLSACTARLDAGALVLGKKVMELDPIAMRQMGREPVCDAERARWAELCREARSAAGLPEQPIDHRSYERQGVEAIPQVHLGPAAKDNLERHLAGENVTLLDRTRQWLEREEARAALREAQRLEAEIEEEEAAELAGAIEAEPVAEPEPELAPRPRRVWRELQVRSRAEPEPEEERRPSAQVIQLYQEPPAQPLRTRGELEALLAEAERMLAELEKRREQQRRAKAAWEAAGRELAIARGAQAEARASWWGRAAALVGLGPLAAAERRLAAAEAAIGPARQEAEQTTMAVGLAQRRLDQVDVFGLQRELDQVREIEQRDQALVEWVLALVVRAHAVVPYEERGQWRALRALDLAGGLDGLRARLARDGVLLGGLARDLEDKLPELERLELDLERRRMLPPLEDEDQGDDQGPGHEM